MKIDHPTPGDIPALRRLWTAAFGDTGEFLDGFFNTGYAPHRCLCLYENGVLAAALYWFDCHVQDKKAAYLYAVATDTVYRGRGFCRELMAKTHALLRQRGYALALLVPGSESLRKMYETMGYLPCTRVREFSCDAGGETLSLTEVSPTEFARLRRELLPPGGVVQEGENLEFLRTCARLCAGDGCLLAADGDGRIVELLGDAALAPRILQTLGKSRGSFRTPGEDTPFAMALPLVDGAPLPAYFGLAFD